MADIWEKEITKREAIAEAKVIMKPSAIRAIRGGNVPKGDVLAAAKLAGLLAAKQTPLLLPLCHPLLIDHVAIDFSFGRREINIRSTVRGTAKTGFEMEALTATAIAALTIYDMCKPLDKEIIITEIRLVKKSGGKSERGKRQDDR